MVGQECRFCSIVAGETSAPIVLDTRESSSKDDRGVVTVETKGFNQHGDEVCYFRRKLMVWKRESAPQRQYPYDDTVFDAE